MFTNLKEKINNFELNKYIGFCKAGIVAQENMKEFGEMCNELIERGTMDDKDWIRNNPENYVYCKHLEVIEMVMTADGIECPLYKCKKGHSICQESMKSPPCEDFELRNEIDYK